MDINKLIEIIKKKLQKEILIENIIIEDKSFLHKNHIGNETDRFHLKISIESNELKKLNKIEGTRKIYKILDKEIKKFIHSLQLLIH
tara:strand:+ start:36 stop:296 length:261 start_codon:yes stop_codon:yes gene_type:complete